MSKSIDYKALAEIGLYLQESGIIFQRMTIRPKELDWRDAQSETYMVQKWAKRLGEMFNMSGD